MAKRTHLKTIGLRDSEGFLSDANHFLLESCPVVQSIGLNLVKKAVLDSFGFRTHFLSRWEILQNAKLNMINRQVYASRGTQNVPFFRTNLTLIPGLPAIATVSPGDIKVLTPPELAKESAEDVGVIPIESAVKPSEEVGDLSNVAADQWGCTWESFV